MRPQEKPEPVRQRSIHLVSNGNKRYGESAEERALWMEKRAEWEDRR